MVPRVRGSDLRFRKEYWDRLAKLKKKKQRALVRLAIELTAEESARAMELARNEKLSRKRWLQQVIRKAIDDSSQR
jgi:hypothetical protein